LFYTLQYNLGVMYVGAPACGMNAAARAFVRVALTQGYNVLGIRYGFEGLLVDDVGLKRSNMVLLVSVCI